MNLPAFLTQGPYGEILITGHRIGLYHVIVHHRSGESAEQLHQRYPTLPLELIEAVLTFYRANPQEVDAYVSREQAALDQLRATTPRKVDWEELQQRLPALPRIEFIP
jgi:uncharacterized protein (DUF433 family)